MDAAKRRMLERHAALRSRRPPTGILALEASDDVEDLEHPEHAMLRAGHQLRQQQVTHPLYDAVERH